MLKKAPLVFKGSCRVATEGIKTIEYAIILTLRFQPPQPPSEAAQRPGRNHRLLPTLAKNVPQAHFLNASSPLSRWSLFFICNLKPICGFRC